MLWAQGFNTCKTVDNLVQCSIVCPDWYIHHCYGNIIFKWFKFTTLSVHDTTLTFYKNCNLKVSRPMKHIMQFYMERRLVVVGSKIVCHWVMDTLAELDMEILEQVNTQCYNVDIDYSFHIFVLVGGIHMRKSWLSHGSRTNWDFKTNYYKLLVLKALVAFYS